MEGHAIHKISDGGYLVNGEGKDGAWENVGVHRYRQWMHNGIGDQKLYYL